MLTNSLRRATRELPVRWIVSLRFIDTFLILFLVQIGSYRLNSVV